MKHLLLVITTFLFFTLKAFSFTQIVTVQNDVFTPTSFTINLGDTVKWTWVSGSHTTTSLTIPGGAATWDHPINTTNKSFIYVPAVTGVYNYKCTFHFAMGMTGNFTVVCPKPAEQISAGGSTTFCKGGSVMLNATITNQITSYQWQRNGKNIANATASTYSASATGAYALIVKNNCGSADTSNAINVTVNPLPSAVITPADSVLICKGDSVTLQTNKGAALSYQWQRNSVNIQGATLSAYTTKTGGNYRVIVTRTTTGCSRQSAITKVKIQCPGLDVVSADIMGVKIFPNPSTNNFHVVIPSSLNNNQLIIIIYDDKGNAVSNNKISSNSLTVGDNLKRGVYLVQIKNETGIIFQQKVIKE